MAEPDGGWTRVAAAARRRAGAWRRRLSPRGTRPAVAPADARAPAEPDWVDVGDRLPQQVRDDNFHLLAAALEEAGVDWWYVTGLTAGQHVVAVAEESRPGVLAALSSPLLATAYVRDGQEPAAPVPAATAATTDLAGAAVLQVGVPSRARSLRYDLDHGCELEFWIVGARVLAPRPNRAAAELSPADLVPVETEVAGRGVRMPVVFTRRMLDDITFDIDVVYTWVDGDDPAWRELRDRALAEASGVVFHAEATYDARFRSRDELRYSLRSIAMYAPWVRKVFLVTNGQVPDWLAEDGERVEVVPHQAIFADPADLPTFNSNAIISRLHHIPGLSEHYLYFNDDVFLAGPVSPGDFFTPSGLAKVFPANNRRPFGTVDLADGPHFNLTRNIRGLLEREFGITISRAIWHTPHPQLRSVHFELEERFAQEYRHTWSSRFRRHDDIVADQLHHYYVQITGRGVPGAIRYEYINLGDDEYRPRMEKLLRTRRFKTFCLNDAPEPGRTPISDELVREWLEELYPVPSAFERSSAASTGTSVNTPSTP